MMEWPFVQWFPSPRKPTAGEAITAFLLMLPLLASVLYRIYAKIRRRDGRSVGLQILSDVSNSDHVKYEIIAVHGLGASPEHTWTCKSDSKSKTGDTQAPVHLLKDLLMKDERFLDARILNFAYNSDWLVDACFESSRDIGLCLIESLIEHRKNHPRLPLIFVGHSFGGIVIKEALSSHPDDVQRILEDTCGIVFLGTPHLGSPVAGFGATIAYLTGFLGSNTGLLLFLRSNGEMLMNLSKAFQACIRKKHRDLNKGTTIVSICEKKPTYLLNCLYAGKIVPWESAIFGANFADVYEVDKDHSGLNKCINSEDPLYKELTAQLHRIRPTTPPKINTLQQTVIDRLMPVTAGDAEFHPSLDEYGKGHLECLPQTRETLLKDIYDWLDGHASFQQHIYWLHGKAGTGKSTIARTVVSRMAKEQRTVVNFFFKRGEGDRSRLKRFFTTLAAQLVRKLPSLAEYVQDALESDPSLPEQHPRTQFKKLIQEPMQGQKLNNRKAVVVVIDALDECDSEEDLSILIQQLSQPILLTDATESSSGRIIVQYFLTSRLDHHTQSDFNKISEQRCEKRELEKATWETTGQDIGRYLQFQLERIDGLLDPLPGRDLWSNPSDVLNLKRLTERAYPLFEFAAASCRFIEQTTIPGGPRDRLQDLLQSNVCGNLDGVYLPILRRRFYNLKGRSHRLAKAQFQDVIGSVISLADSVTLSCLARLIGQSEPAVYNELRLFESVLVVPAEQGSQSHVGLFHESFRDFFVGSEANEEFKIDTIKAHALLASRCHQILCGSFLKKIGNLKNISGVHRREVTEEIHRSFLSPEVQYAGRFWIYHLKMSESGIRDGDDWYSFLVSHFLHWLEALSLSQRTSESASLLKELQTIIHPADGTQIRPFLEDAHRFVLSFRQIINAAPLQLYSSALTFSPTNSIVRKTFDAYRPKWIVRTPKIESQWSPCLQTLEGHSERVTCVAFSSEGILASGDTNGIVKVWDPTSGVCLQTFCVDDKWNFDVKAVAFSRAGKLACRTVKSIAVWDISQGICLQELEYEQHIELGREISVGSMAFVDEQRLLLTGGRLHRVLILELGHDFEEQFKLYLDRRLILSSDGQWVASFAGGEEIKICSMNSEANYSLRGLEQFGAPAPEEWLACFSRDNQYFASRSKALRVQIWNVASTACLQILDDSDFLSALTFSPDNRLITTGHAGGRIIIWDWKDSIRLHTLTGHSSSVLSLAFSPDGAWVASASMDHTVKIWDTSIHSFEKDSKTPLNTTDITMTMGGQRLAIFSAFACESQLWDDFGSKCIELPTDKGCHVLAISANGNMLAWESCSGNGIQIWDMESGKILPALGSHISAFEAIAFSANGERIISGSVDGRIQLWESRTGQLLKELRSRRSQKLKTFTYRTAISLDGEQVASEANGWIWAENLRMDMRRHFYLSGIRNLGFSPNGERLAAVSQNWSGVIWDLATGACLRKFNSELSYPNSTWQLNSSFINFDFAMIADSPEERPLVDCLTKYHISPDGVWIMRYAEKLLWLPPEYRPSDAAASRPNIAIGRKSGRPFVIGLSDDGL